MIGFSRINLSKYVSYATNLVKMLNNVRFLIWQMIEEFDVRKKH